jgi:twitching motility two-component system response regulator PilG
MLIDDSWVAVKVASKVLQAFHFETLTANSAKTGYEILEKRYKDVKIIFLDVVMPKVDGVECLGWIKDNSDFAHIPVYMLSGLEDQTLSDVCIERGAEGMLIKPLSIPVVMGILQAHNLGDLLDDPGEAALTPADASTNANATNSSASRQSAPAITNSSNHNQISAPSSNSNGNTGNNSNTVSNSASAESRSQAATSTKQAPMQPAALLTLQVGQQASPFKLVDTKFKDFVYPSLSQKKNLLLAFVPSIYCAALYAAGGFMQWLFEVEEDVTAQQVSIVCISK